MSDSRVDFPWDWTHVDQSLQIKVGAGALHTVTINQLAAGDTVTIYDGADIFGAVMAIIATALSQPVTLIYDARVETGIFIAIAGQGPNDLTVNYI